MEGRPKATPNGSGCDGAAGVWQGSDTIGTIDYRLCDHERKQLRAQQRQVNTTR